MNTKNIVFAPENQLSFSTDALEAMEKRVNNSYLGCDDVLPLFAIKHSVRRTLPYGKWICEGGREVVFNREYQPILQRKDGVVSYADRNERVKGIVQHEYYYDDGSDPADLLVRKLHLHAIDKHDRARSKRSLLICLTVLREFTPQEHGSVNDQWSALK